MGSISYIRRQGRLIEVETIEFGGPTKKRKGEPFLLLTHQDAVRGFIALGRPSALVWYALLYRVWAEKNKTVRVPTKLLRSWGVERRCWARSLIKLERVGLIRVDKRHHGCAAQVTLLRGKDGTRTAR